MLVLLFGVLCGGVYFFAPTLLAKQVESEGFRRMLSQEVSKALKVDGEFAPISLDGWTAVTDSYKSTGQPGQAIGALNANGIRGTFNPAGVFRSQWELDLIHIEKGFFALREPDDALKQAPPAAGKRPWYAGLMPQRFYCRWIEAPSAEVQFPFANTTGGLKDVHLGATMIGQNFKYYVNGGTFEFPMLPTLAVDYLEIYVTRNIVQIDQAWFRGLNNGPERMSLSGTMGQQKDKSIDANMDFKVLSLSAMLPESVREAVTGTASGEIHYKCDSTGKNANGSGQLTLTGATLANWGALDELSRIHNNPELKSFTFQDFDISYVLENDVFRIDVLDIAVENKIRLTGGVQYNLHSDAASLDVQLSEMPLSTWLPRNLKTLTDAVLRGHLKWAGSVKDWKSSTASGHIDMSGASLENPVKEIASLGPHKIRFPDDVNLKTALINFSYDAGNFKATELDLVADGFFSVKGSGAWTAEDRLQTDLDFSFTSLSVWLPKTLENQISGSLSGSLDWDCPGMDLANGHGGGTLNLDGTKLRDFDFQKILARFFKDDSWLEMDFDTAVVTWSRTREGIFAKDIIILAKGQIGLRGDLKIATDGTVSGVLYGGTNTEALKWLPDATSTVFSESKDGLHWAKIKLSGDLKHPKNDLTPQILAQLEKHPLALAEMAVRGLSWWLGDELGTAPGSHEAPKTHITPAEKHHNHSPHR